MPLVTTPDGRRLYVPDTLTPRLPPAAIEQAPMEGGQAPSMTPMPIPARAPLPIAAAYQSRPPPATPPEPPPKQQVEQWLAFKASRYPQGTTPEQAAKWQAYDRDRYELFLGKKGGK